MTGLEKAIRTGNYKYCTPYTDGIPWSNGFYRLGTVKYIVSEDDFLAEKARIQREDARKAWTASHLWETPENVEHTATMAGIMDAYADYKLSIAWG